MLTPDKVATPQGEGKNVNAIKRNAEYNKKFPFKRRLEDFLRFLESLNKPGFFKTNERNKRIKDDENLVDSGKIDEVLGELRRLGIEMNEVTIREKRLSELMDDVSKLIIDPLYWKESEADNVKDLAISVLNLDS